MGATITRAGPHLTNVVRKLELVVLQLVKTTLAHQAFGV